MKVLVTGATGFIGGYVVRELINQGYRVVATSKNPEKAKAFEWISQVQYIPCDLNAAQENFFQFFRQPDLLIHLAWEGLPNYKDLFHLEENLFSNYRFLKNMLEYGLKHLVVTGIESSQSCLAENLNEPPWVVSSSTSKRTSPCFTKIRRTV